MTTITYSKTLRRLSVISGASVGVPAQKWLLDGVEQTRYASILSAFRETGDEVWVQVVE